jgi:phosphomethylpyrimidine synthase
LIAIVGLTSQPQAVKDELSKVRIAQKYGVAMIADVSTTGGIEAFQMEILNETDMPLSSVPLYEVYRCARNSNTWDEKLPRSLVLETIESQAGRGVDCMTLHASHTRKLVEAVNSSNRRVRIQGRGGGLIHEFMLSTGRENPIYEWYDDILDILRKYGVSLSLGNCLRSGTVDDPIDEIISSEVECWSELAARARMRNVNVMIEGLSHLRMHAIQPYIQWVTAACRGAPVRMLGPIGTERGLGYDHISGAITAVEAIRSGAALLTVITRAEHIGLPNIDELREAIVAFRIAIELATQPEQTAAPDTTFTCGLGFEALPVNQFFDLERAVELKRAKNNGNLRACSMCNELCRMRIGSGRLIEDRTKFAS